MQSLEPHPLAKEFNTIFIGAECSSFERLKKLLNTLTLRALIRSPTRSPERRRTLHEIHRQISFKKCSFHSRNGQRCNHTDEECRDPRNYNSPHYDPSKKSSPSQRPAFNRGKPGTSNREIKNLLTALLQGKKPSKFKRHLNKTEM